ncbi:hypothetical protein BGX28_003018, partial [Mortierella sp. GBA30]
MSPFERRISTPQLYQTRGYAIRGSIRTDGFRLQLLAFKLRELNMVKLEDIKVLALDCGQVCAVGAYAYLSKADAIKESEGQESQMDMDVPDMAKDDDITMQDLCGVNTSLVLAPDSVTPTDPALEKVVYHNLEPVKFRQWMEHQKNIKSIVNIDNPDEPTSISVLECRLPALHGDGSSIISYVKELEKVEARLDAFLQLRENALQKAQVGRRAGSEHR